MRRAREVLKLLTEKFPTLEGRRHCVMLDTEPGSTDVMCIGLSFGAEWLGIKLDAMSDLDREPADLVAEISRLVEVQVQQQANLRIAEALLAEAEKKLAEAEKKRIEADADPGRVRIALDAEELEDE